MIQQIKCTFGYHAWDGTGLHSERVSRGDDWVYVYHFDYQCKGCGIEREEVKDGLTVSKEQFRKTYLAKRPEPKIMHWAPCPPAEHVFPFPKPSPHGLTPAWVFADIYLTCERCGMQVPASKRFDTDYLTNGIKSVTIPAGVAWRTAVPARAFPANYPTPGSAYHTGSDAAYWASQGTQSFR